MTGESYSMATNALANVRNTGRVEIVDPDVFERLDLSLSDAAFEQIRRLEESVLTAEERLGYFRVG